MTYYTSIKEVQAEFVSMATILNEKGKNDIINVKVLIYSLMPIEPSIKDPPLTLGTAKLSDNPGNIQITVFASLVNEIKVDNAFLFTYFQASRFQSDHLIKSTKQTIVTPISDDEFEIPEDGNGLALKLLHHNIDSVLSSTLEVKHCCFLCKSVVEVNGN